MDINNPSLNNDDDNNNQRLILNSYDSYGELVNMGNELEYDEQPNFGLLFDLDGVLFRGSNVFPNAVEAFNLLKNPNTSELVVPVAFVTNGCGDVKQKAKLISKSFNTNIYPDQIIIAPSPLSAFKEYHNKRVLFIGQEHLLDLAHELGFINAITLDDVRSAYPLLDMVDHSNRKRLSRCSPEPIKLDRVEMIILIGEPVCWESNLQLLIDLLITNGKPDEVPFCTNYKDHIPIIACNMDLVYMDKAILPRFGHGAFLICLENLYKTMTGENLTYTSILGKPSEITFRFAEHTLTLMSKRMGYTRPIDRIYFFGDNPHVDIVGANLYNNFLRRFRHISGTEEDEHLQHQKASVSNSRTVPPQTSFLPQTARGIDSILVRTGVYRPNTTRTVHHCHRDFQGAVDLILPTFEAEDCLEGLKFVLNKQNYSIKNSNK